jgi:hypothetical protein
VESSNINAHRACREQHQTGSAFTYPQPAFDFTGSRLVAVCWKAKALDRTLDRTSAS